MKISDQGLAFIAGHEGFVSKAYRDPIGIWTIGFGFTSRSAAVRKYIGKVRPGMTVSREHATTILRAVVDEEFGPATAKGMPGAHQHEFDMGASACFNVGARIFAWKWAKAFRSGKINQAAALWRMSATTANGKRLTGLVRRRQEEADLLHFGKYATHGRQTFQPANTIARQADPTLKEYQRKLKELGHDPGPIDGLHGPQTTATIRLFQRADPNLKVDGVLGRATMDSIDRRLEAKSSGKVGTTGVGIGIVGQVLSWFQMLPEYVAYGAYAIAGVVILYLLWKYRGFFETKFRETVGA